MSILLYLFYGLITLPFLYLINFYGLNVAVKFMRDGDSVPFILGLMVFCCIIFADVFIFSGWKRAASVAIGKRETYTSSSKDDE